MNTISKRKIAFSGFFLILLLTPIINIINFNYTYIINAFIFFTILLFARPKKIKSLLLNWILPAFIFYTITLISHHNDQLSIVNASALFFIWILVSIISSKLTETSESTWQVINTLPFAILIGLSIYTALSIVLAGPLGLANPITDITSGNRFRLMTTPETGHSIAIDLAYLGLALCLANISIFSGKLRWSWLIFFLAILILAKSATAWVLIISAGCLFIAESVGKKNKAISLFGYFIIIASIAFLSKYSNETLKYLRTTLQGNDATIYREDLTAGRSELNSLLLAGIMEAPISGLGHGHPILQIGLKDASGKGANSESGLRLAAKYGIPYSLAILFIIALPLNSFRTKNRNLRVFSLLFSSGILLMSSTNSPMEVPHSYSFFFYTCISIILFKASKKEVQKSSDIFKAQKTRKPVKPLML